MTTTKEWRVMGKSIPKVGAVEMITGRAIYAADISLPGMLYGKVLRSPYAHGRIKRIDVSKALALPGVKGIITGADFPPMRQGISIPMGDNFIDISSMPLVVMARDKVIYHGHPVAAVAATDPYIAEYALSLIEVEYEELPPLLDVLEAIKPEAVVIHDDLRTKDLLGNVESDKPTNVASHLELGRGDVEEGFAEAGAVAEASFQVNMAHQGYIEPRAATAQVDPDGKMTLWTTTQASFNTQAMVSTILGISQSQLKVVPTEIGGGFGGKWLLRLEPLVLLLSQKTGRPVQIVMTREEALRATGPGAAMAMRVKAGCKKDGTLTAIDVWMAFGAGCVSGSPVGAAVRTGVAPYKVSNLRINGYDVVTNTTNVEAYRAPGAPQAAFGVEQVMDMLAQKIGMDPVEFRMVNAVEEGDLQPTDQLFNHIGLKEVLHRVKESDHYRSPLEGSNRGRGVAVGMWYGGAGVSSANVALHRDGTAVVILGAVDLTGTRTTTVQIAAEELGLNPEDIHVTVSDTESSPYSDASGGSRITYTLSHAIQRACQDLLVKMRSRAADRLRVQEGDLEYSGGKFYIREAPETTIGLKDLFVGGDGVVTGTGSTSRLRLAPVFAANIVDLEVDPDTGKTTLLRYTIFQDAGLAVNPARVQVQMQGGAVQGIGWALTEEYLFDERAQLRNPSLLDYRQPTALDVPMLDTEIIEVPASDGPYGIRGVGEAPIVAPAATIANGIARATGVRMTEMPMTPERVLQALKRKES